MMHVKRFIAAAAVATVASVSAASLAIADSTNDAMLPIQAGNSLWYQ
jgi:hypothetical protein